MIPHRIVKMFVGMFVIARGVVWAQSFTFIPSDTMLSAPLGSEMVFNCPITNTSASGLTLCVLRTMNDLPQGWESSMCFDVCFPPEVDSVVSSELNPGDTRPFSLHVYGATNSGTGIIRVVARNTHNSVDQRILTFRAVYTLVGVRETRDVPAAFSLSQNYPNPFNPTTRIQFTIPVGTYGHTSLRVIDILGREVATLINEDLKPGSYEATFDASRFSSGTYLYRLESNGATQTRKLLLLR